VQTEATLSGLESLPTLAPVAARLLQITSDPGTSARDLAAVILTDPALSTRVLRLVNSAAMGVRHEISSVQRATSLLGFHAIRNCALSVKVFDAFKHVPSADGFDALGFWRHSLGVACCAQLLARHVPHVDGEEVFTAGMLHDVGKIAAAQCLPEGMVQLPAVQAQTRLGTLEVERHVFGLSHSRIGAIVCSRWGLPSVFKHGALLHHVPAKYWPEDGLHAPSLLVVQLADRVCREQHLGLGGVYKQEPTAETLASELGLSQEGLRAVCRVLREDVEQKAEALDMGDAKAEDLFMEGIERANEELGLINEELVVANVRLAEQRRLIEEDLRLAELVQRTLIPPDLTHGPVQVRVRYEPATKVGGDYAYFDLDGENLCVCVGDVTGHGIAAALVTNRIHGEVVRLVRENVWPEDLVRGLNRFLCETLGSSQLMMSFVCVRISLAEGKLWYANAAHPPPLLLTSGSSRPFQKLDSHATFLGVSADLLDEVELQTELAFRPGQHLVIYTDGVPEAFDPKGRPLGMARWTEMVHQYLNDGEVDPHHRLAQDVKDYVSGELADDVTIMLVTTPALETPPPLDTSTPATHPAATTHHAST